MTNSNRAILLFIVVIFAFLKVSHAERLEFSYIGGKSPEFWHLLSNETTICQTGTKQSPIDILPQDLKTFAKPPSPMFNNAKNVESIHNGNTVEIFSGTEGVPLPAEITIEGEKYELQQFHFHTPSEHRVNGRHRDIEQHLVFKSKSEKISVVAVFYDVSDKPSMFMMPITNDLPKCKGEKKKLKKVELSSLLIDTKNITEAFTYSGSLTTPPCTEGVTWYVNQSVQDISLDQFLSLREVIGFNARFTQLRLDDEQPGTYEQTPEVPGTENPPVTENSYEQQSSDPYFKRSLYSRSHFRKSK